MPLVFSYGSLREKGLQMATYGRLLSGRVDEAPGYTLGRVEPHWNAQHTGHPTDRVAGTAFELTDAELAVTDQYERRDDYVRRQLVLASGAQAWMYVHGGVDAS
jgi:gamma-glutamylcyclotransferase (GGCT)/AIG2-like uncharacterized protein YtfP